MLKETKAFSSFSVDDIGEAKDFYGKTLALKVMEEEMGNIALHLSGGVRIIVYPKPNHTPATFTVLNFQVEDIETAVDQLTEKGITFEQYGGELQTDERGISRGEGPLIAWFRDPAGNILSVIEAE